jgi:hypothetical protein
MYSLIKSKLYYNSCEICLSWKFSRGCTWGIYSAQKYTITFCGDVLLNTFKYHSDVYFI